MLNFKNIGIQTKLIILFIIMKVIPLIIISYIAFEGIKNLESIFEEEMKHMIKSNYEVVKDTANIAIEDSIKALDKKSQISLEILTKNIASDVATFLYERDNDIIFLASIDNLNKEILTNFNNSKQKKIIIPQDFEYDEKTSKWIATKSTKDEKSNMIANIKDNQKYFNYNKEKKFNTKLLNIYKEIAFIDLEGYEKFKVSSINQELKDISNQENTYCKAEDYFKKLKDLKKGEIYVSNVIGEYVGTKIIGSFTKEKAENIGIKFEPEKYGYAGFENPKGKRFEGIIRFVTPKYKNGKKIGYISMALDHRHIMEYTDYVIPTKDVISNYSDASRGNYAFMWDNNLRSISHPRDYFIYGYNKDTGKQVKPWLSAEVAKELDKSGKNWEEFLKDYPVFHNQSLKQKPNISQLKIDGEIELDCKYLNFAPQCNGWNQIVEDGGYGSFVIFWSKVWKLTTVAPIPYYTGQYGNSKKGFGIVTMGANLDEFHKATETTKANIDNIIDNKIEDIKSISIKIDKKIDSFVNKAFEKLSLYTVVMIIIVILIAIWMAKYITSSVQKIIKGTEEFQKNNLNYKINIDTNDEMGRLGKSFNQMAESIKLLFQEQKELNETLELKVEQRTSDLNNAKLQIEKTHNNMTDSINYALLIQKSILPSTDILNNYLKDFYIHWKPRSIVGGDIFFITELKSKNEILIMVIDGAGHGVPGAFVTMLVKAIENKIIADIQSSNIEPNPALILQQFNKIMKQMLKQNNKSHTKGEKVLKSNTGFDGGVLYYNKDTNKCTYAGAKTPLYIINNNELEIIKSDRKNVGFIRTKIDQEYTLHNIDIKENTKLYIITDGIIDQYGKNNKLYGKERFKKMILDNNNKDFNEQKTILIDDLKDFQDNLEQNDDITILGLKF